MVVLAEVSVIYNAQSFSVSISNPQLFVHAGDNTYAIFHNFWNTVNLNIPEATIHYERMTSKNDIAAAIQTIITYMGEHNIQYDANAMSLLLQQKVDKVKSMVKEPEYEHGTLMARICGVEAAIMLHEKTRAYSKALGYVFDRSTGHWSLKL